MADNNLENVKVGDRVWYGGKYDYKQSKYITRHLTTVTKVTPKRFSDSRYTWSKIDGGSINEYCGRALSIATPEEITAREAEQDRLKAEQARQEAARKQQIAKANVLRGAFPEHFNIYLEDDGETYNITFNDLTESEVRSLADKLE